ncbi:MAG TPA: hypothetical protein VD948_08450, partial [Rhodothermales bacterium]|nr:hypothetical protein [Rhodothermales bacterium]
TDCMMLQEGIEFEEYYRCYGIGQRDVHVMRYNPSVEFHERYSAVPSEPIAPDRLARLERDVLALCRALGYDMNTVEFAVRDGIPYAIDFMNPAPDADYWSVGQTNYEWVIRHMGAFLVEKALEERHIPQFTANGALEPFGGRGLIGAVAGVAGAAVEAVKKVVTRGKSSKNAAPVEDAPVPLPGPETAPEDLGDAAASVPEAEVLEVSPATKPRGKRQTTTAAPAQATKPTPSAAKSTGGTGKTAASKGKASTAPSGKTAGARKAPRDGGARGKRSDDTPPDQRRPSPKPAPARANAVAAAAAEAPTTPSQPTPGPETEATSPANAKRSTRRNGGKKS